jgi:hypothetical protein
MFALRVVVCVFVCLLPAAVAAEPRVTSVHPSAVQRGAPFHVVIRGTGLAGAHSVFLQQAPFTVEIEGSTTEPPPPNARNKTPIDLVRARVHAAPDAEPGPHSFRVVTPDGVSNAVPLHVTGDPVSQEPEGSHETPETAVPVDARPVVMAASISKRGEADYYSFTAKTGEAITFEVISGVPSGGFDPAITIFEESGSWFDPKRANRIAYNDEPMWAAGRPTDAQLAHRFAKAGRYLARIEAFSGLGGPDYTYQLRIRGGESQWKSEPPGSDWQERRFERPLSADRLNALAVRGGKPPKQTSIETYRATAGDPALFKLPGTLDGVLASPGDVHRARFQIDGPQDIAIEVQTPAAAPPLFNPIVRLLDGAGEEVATNVLAGVGACSGELSKSLQAKATVPLRNPGEYTVEIRDTTSDLGGPDFRYRVQVRPQIPHIGEVGIEEDRLNLAPGAAKAVRVTFDREEDYRGAIAVAADGLPPGVRAMAGADFEPDRDPIPFPGRRERYTPRSERAVIVFTAATDSAPMQQPHVARVLVLPVVDGKPGEPLASKEIPVMVVRKP